MHEDAGLLLILMAAIGLKPVAEPKLYDDKWFFV